MPFTRRVLLKRVTTLIVSVTLALSVGGCALFTTEEDFTDYFGYLFPGAAVTSNAASWDGVSSRADAIASRVYPGVYSQGPNGESIPNTDLISVETMPAPVRTLRYTISENAQYSDGQPLTCDDYLLAFTAGVMTPLFDSFEPQAFEVDRLDCSPGAKTFTVIFKGDAGLRWRYLFGPGSVLPFHAIAAKAGVTQEQLHQALLDRNVEALASVAQVWNRGFRFDSFDSSLQVASGPYRIEGIGSSGEVKLVRNDLYAGDPATLETLVLWPRNSDKTKLQESQSIKIADLSADDGQWIDPEDSKNTVEIQRISGSMVDSLVLSQQGVLESPEARTQFAACIDHNAVAQASSEAAGVQVLPTALHVVSPNDPRASGLASINDNLIKPNPPVASLLSGATIRIGYSQPDSRKKAMVQAISQSCSQFGITIEDVSGTAGTVGTMPEGADAILLSLDPQVAYPVTGSGDTASIEALLAAETREWNNPSIIPLAAEPKVFLMDKRVTNVAINPHLTGMGWNMDRWRVGKVSR